jgi:hypothetical protein
MLYFRQSSVEVFLLALSFKGQGRVFTIATTFQIGQTKFKYWWEEIFSPNSFHFNGYQGFFSWGAKQLECHHSPPSSTRLTFSEAISLLPLCTFKAQTGHLYPHCLTSLTSKITWVEIW